MSILKERKYIGLLLFLIGMLFSFLVATTNFTYDVMVFLTQRPDPPRNLSLWFLFYWCCLWIMSAGMWIWLRARGVKNKAPLVLKVCGAGLLFLAFICFYHQFIATHSCGVMADYNIEMYHMLQRKVYYVRGLLVLLSAMGCLMNARRILVYAIAGFLLVQITWSAIVNISFRS
jgi:hypothetical protein